MGFWKNVADFMTMPDVSGFEQKSGMTVVTKTVPQLSADQVEAMLLDGDMMPRSHRVSAVHACARVIAEGLALPPCYLRKQVGSQRKLAENHPLFALLNGAPNDRQTSYEFREMLGWQLALNGNAYVWINRLRDGSVYELLPADPGKVSVTYDDTGLWSEPTYYLYGQAVPRDQVWHLRGPSWLSWRGNDTLADARKAIGLAHATETYGAKLFENGARPGGIIRPANGASLTPDQVEALKAQTQAYAGSHNAHRTMVLTGPVDFTPLSSTADEAQFIETRKFQIEEICRFFRVSPLKVFQQVGSHSYASVEQAHIAHETDTDAHWHQRFAQSATLNLLTPAERRAGYGVTIDNKAIRQGTTAAERMAYWTAGISNGIYTQNEARQAEGYDPVDDPDADTLKKAANIAGLPGPDSANTDGPGTDSKPSNKG